MTFTKGLAIQITPHHNGEIFLSSSAASQNPSFFGIPFAGSTTPKLAGQNPSYPQRIPDPRCNIEVFDVNDTLILQILAYNLNMVYYSRKDEIRITASPLVPVVPAYSVMLMTISSTPGIDYDLKIYTPQSSSYQSVKDLCNQKMPSGGNPDSRWFGWF
ncbi:TPA: hypothetical protein ACHP3V_001019 [Pseudomonas aeruginosa]|uniref:hypothetical protein n=1 Tax=Pseudomonas aeruginosa TaxID=287 RepID=UPI001296A980|nr:hypothetical protein [Pseudomonas aeruginosa]ELP1286843.1 hypothetical protein [Pseudomonas aeruginosa]MCV0105771.1 hypothetical protein [Pseudomonas aeruginosa]MCV0111853.1 hypothetical protein [Pseudomonas aeruginosa]HBO5222974.1 hypothetical protein [Pseudomonas aeruginosa]HCF4135090.1 hypothetical protein [Pseudomonas aeruginosa]